MVGIAKKTVILILQKISRSFGDRTVRYDVIGTAPRDPLKNSLPPNEKSKNIRGKKTLWEILSANFSRDFLCSIENFIEGSPPLLLRRKLREYEIGCNIWYLIYDLFYRCIACPSFWIFFGIFMCVGVWVVGVWKYAKFTRTNKF